MSNLNLRRHSYQVTSRDPSRLALELNSILSKIGLRLDQLDAVGQSPDLRGKKIKNISQDSQVKDPALLNESLRTTKGVDAEDDLIINHSEKGLVMKDSRDPAHYWRTLIDHQTGSLKIIDLGTTKP